jgi:hypothetical protein
MESLKYVEKRGGFGALLEVVRRDKKPPLK